MLNRRGRRAFCKEGPALRLNDMMSGVEFEWIPFSVRSLVRYAN
jgi:hypothetical protein